jgi:hypothetical protein
MIFKFAMVASSPFHRETATAVSLGCWRYHRRIEYVIAHAQSVD